MATIKTDILSIETELKNTSARNRRVGIIQKTAAAISGVGELLPSPAMIGATITIQDTATTPALRHASGAALGNQAGMQSTLATMPILCTANPEFSTKVRVGILGEDYRATVGLGSTAGTGGVDFTLPAVTAVQFIGFQTNNPAVPLNNYQGNWVCITSNGTTTTRTQTSISKPNAFSTIGDTTNKLRFKVTGNGTAVDFYIDEVWVARHLTNIPTFNLGIFIDQRNLIAASKALEWSLVKISWDG